MFIEWRELGGMEIFFLFLFPTPASARTSLGGDLWEVAEGFWVGIVGQTSGLGGDEGE